MKLCNFSNTSYHLEWYDGEWQKLNQFLVSQGLDGIELLLHGNYDIESIPKEIVKGLHLSYFPTWLEFYKGQEIYKEDFPLDEDLHRTFQGTTPEVIVNRFKEEYKVAQSLKVNYMVFHVAHVTTKDAYHFTYNYSNTEVLKATSEIVNKSFLDDSEIELLFENLWWPGLKLLSKEELDDFMASIRYPHKGVMLDLSHLILTSNDIQTVDHAVDYILEVLTNLGESIKWIKGIHINQTLAHEYQNENHQQKFKAYQLAELSDKFMLIYQHISTLDQHQPFESHRLREIVKVVKPTYKMIEVVGKTKEDWEDMITRQLEYL